MLGRLALSILALSVLAAGMSVSGCQRNASRNRGPSDGRRAYAAQTVKPAEVMAVAVYRRPAPPVPASAPMPTNAGVFGSPSGIQPIPPNGGIPNHDFAFNSAKVAPSIQPTPALAAAKADLIPIQSQFQTPAPTPLPAPAIAESHAPVVRTHATAPILIPELGPDRHSAGLALRTAEPMAMMSRMVSDSDRREIQRALAPLERQSRPIRPLAAEFPDRGHFDQDWVASSVTAMLGSF